MSEHVQVSVVIAGSESSTSLAESILSAISPVDANLEVVVVVDPQRSEVVAVARQAAVDDPRIRVIEFDAIRGRGGAVNAGVGAARGEYLVFPAVGEVLSPFALRRLIGTLEGSRSDLLVASSEFLGTVWPRDSVSYLMASGAVTSTNLAKLPSLVEDVSASTKVFRRQFFVEQNVQAVEGADTDDVSWVVSALIAAKAIDVVDTPLVWRPKENPPSRTEAWLKYHLNESRTVLENLAVVAPESASVYARALLRQDVLNRSTMRWIESGALTAEASSLLHEVGRHIGIEDVAGLRIEERWELALVAAGCSGLLGEVRSPNSEHVAEEGEGLGVPHAIRESLGLGNDDLLGAFHSRFRRTSTHLGLDGGGVQEEFDGDPEISVIVPVHNVGRFVDELLLSIRMSVDARIEILVIDDSSTDDTWERVQRHAAVDRRVRALRSSGRGGGQARNLGVELARGEFIAFADGDDLVPPRAYATMLSAARRSDAEIVSGPYLKLFTTSTWDTRSSFSSLYAKEMDAVNLRTLPQMARHRAIWNRLFRRDFWIENSFPFPGVPRSNDIVPFMSALTAASRVTIVPDIVYVYRDRPGVGSMTSGAGTDAYTVSYFTEELMCAQLLRQTGILSGGNEYWDMVLNADGWGNLSKYLEASNAFENSLGPVPALVRQLTALAPEIVFDALEVDRQAVWRLVAAADFTSASVLSRATKNAGHVPFLEVFEAIASAVKLTGLSNRAKSQLVRKYVLRRVIDDPDVRLSENFELVSQFLRIFANDDQLVVSTPPFSWEDRLWRACRLADRSAVLQALSPSPAHPEAELRSTHRHALLTGQKDSHAASYRRILAVRKVNGVIKTYSVGAVREIPNSNQWAADIDLTYLPKHGRWVINIEYDDSWGRRRVPLPMRSAARESVLRADPHIWLEKQNGVDVVTRAASRWGLLRTIARRVKRRLRAVTA